MLGPLAPLFWRGKSVFFLCLGAYGTGSIEKGRIGVRPTGP